MVTSPAITELLAGTSRGDSQSLQQLYAVLYPEIKRVARLHVLAVGNHLVHEILADRALHQQP